MRIFVTGGLGYIGAHTCLDLLEAGHELLVIDNLTNSSLEVKKHIEHLSSSKLIFFKGDIRDSSFLEFHMKKFKPDVVLHFAGLKAVGDSVKLPIEYFDVNVTGSIQFDQFDAGSKR